MCPFSCNRNSGGGKVVVLGKKKSTQFSSFHAVFWISPSFCAIPKEKGTDATAIPFWHYTVSERVLPVFEAEHELSLAEVQDCR